MSCRKLFSEKIGANMRKMGKDKTRAAIIAISAGDVVREHPQCSSELTRPRERIALTPRYYIVLSSASLRLYRKKLNAIRVFFLKKQPDDDKTWKTRLRSVLKEKIGVAPQIGPLLSTGDNYLEFQIDSPTFWYHALHRRYANFLD